ncbi:MAG: hypothetical protein ABII10_01720 [Candidatus Paceibacterota bacterium]
MLKLLKKIDKKCDEYREVLVLLLITVILRIPNFFEPYWYGDEAIYLTIGTGLRQGLRLYTDIIDHKTPLIYYLAMVPNQFSFRLLNLGWMMVTTVLFFLVAKALFKKTKLAFTSSLIFVLLTTLPWLEGHIPNGELFVLGFVMTGLWLITKTALWQNFLSGRSHEALTMVPKEALLLVASGIFFGLGVLTKVPALLDFGMSLLIGWFSLVAVLISRKYGWKKNLKAIWQFAVKSGWLLLGLIIPIVLSIVYFVSKGSGQDYLSYGLLYNFRYAGSWQPELANSLLRFLFTLPGKILMLAGVLSGLSFWKKYTPRFQFIAGWFILSLFAVLLSNRPYPHYFIQLVPAFALLIVELWRALRAGMRKTMIFSALGLLILPFIAAGLLDLRPYSTSEYYGKFFKLITGQITQKEYDHSFNALVKDNYQAAKVIRGLNGHRIFIWGTNPALYALTQTTPTSRFTVSFHIKDFQDHLNTLEQIKKEMPKLIAVMDDESDDFPELQRLLDLNYYPNNQFEHMTLYLLQENSR